MRSCVHIKENVYALT